MKSLARIVVNGETQEVEILDLSREQVTFVVQGRTYKVGYEVALPDSRSESQAGSVPSSRSQKQTIKSHSGKELTTPMPGVVLSLNCKVGDSVNQGDVLVRIEAMKMQNNISSPRAAKIRSISVSVGEEVTDGQVLLEFE